MAVRVQSDPFDLGATTSEFAARQDNAGAIVTFTGIVPDLFEEGADTIVTERLEGDLFYADEVLAKDDEEYRPAELAEAFEERGISLD